MAKTIKSIKCPQCGSNKIKELRPDYYQCQSCKTEFFLDSDDVTIVHKHTFPGLTEKAKKLILIGAGGFILFLLLLPNCFTPRTAPVPTVAHGPKVRPMKEEKKSKWRNYQRTLFVDQAGQPHVITAGITEISRSSEQKDRTIYVASYQPKTGKQEWIHPTVEGTDRGSNDLDMRRFEDGYLYIILNNRHLFRVTPNMQLENADEVFTKANSELAGGIAKYEFDHPKDFTALHIVTNEGSNLVYVPAINKAIPKKEYFNFKATTPPQPQTTTAYAISSVLTHFPEEKIRLVKYTYLHQPGFPHEPPRFGWDKDFGGSGIFTDRSPFVKRFITPYSIKQARIREYKILAEDRNFFSPGILAYNDAVIVLQSRPTPSEDDPFQVQLLDAQTGALLQTLDTRSSRLRQDRFESAALLPDGVLLATRNGGVSYYNKNGKLEWETDPDTLLPVLKK